MERIKVKRYMVVSGGGFPLNAKGEEVSIDSQLPIILSEKNALRALKSTISFLKSRIAQADNVLTSENHSDEVKSCWRSNKEKYLRNIDGIKVVTVNISF
jgi:hypothetical protein